MATRLARPAVDLFLRNLVFDFGATDVVGMPGGLIGFSEPLEDERFAWFIHEAEHLTQLSSPVGLLFTAMGVRAIDLQRDAVASMKDLTEAGFLRSIQAFDRGGDFALLIYQFAEWMKPLLEGLALVSEMEVEHIEGEEVTRTIEVATMVELQQWMQPLLRTDTGREAIAALEAGDPTAMEEMWGMATRQLERPRGLRLEGDLFDSIFWSPPDRESTLPYFYGYLFVKRLESEWRARVPSLTPRRAYELATVAICSTLPCTFMPFCSHWKIETARPSWEAAQAMRALVAALPELSASAVRQLESRDTIWRLDLEGGVLPKATNVRRDHLLPMLIAEVLQHVFGMQTATPDMRKTSDLLLQLEECKFIVPAAVREVTIVAVDERALFLVLVDTQRALATRGTPTPGAVDQQGMTFFQYDPEALSKFAAKMNDVDLDAIERRRFAVLADDLSLNDVAVLRRALFHGMICAPAREAAVPENACVATREAVERIRTAAAKRFGIPLVRWSDSPPSVVLDVTRA